MGTAHYSLIVVLYKSSHHLSRLLHNIADVLPGVDDIILVDNSDEDLSSYASSTVRIINPENNLGYGGGINRGVAAARHENLILINPDIQISSFEFNSAQISNECYIVSGMTKQMKSLPVFPLPFVDLIRIGLCNIGWIFGALRQRFPVRQLDFKDGNAPVDWVPGCLIVTNKKTYKKLGGFDEQYFLFYEEVDLCQRAVLQGIPIGITDTISYENLHGVSSSIDVSTIKMESEMASLMRYHRTYNPGLRTELTILVLKLWSGLIGFGLKIVSLFSSQVKIAAKAKQYLLYYRTLMPFVTREVRSR